jgi:23S rRNA-/tRNA-specific pseudouridylate synthase
MLEPDQLARTERWLVLSKPAGWLTIPGRDQDGVPVLSEWVRRQHGQAWTVHRLDRETSGVVLFALTAEAHRDANEWFSRHQIRKSYDLLAHGALAMPVTRVSSPIEGAPSVTQVASKEAYVASGCLRARAMPLTGRRHQIRIHLASLRCPLLGDTRYGGPETVESAGRSVSVGRVALHAARLELPSKEVFEAPWPEDFAGWVEALREGEAR